MKLLVDYGLAVIPSKNERADVWVVGSIKKHQDAETLMAQIAARKDEFSVSATAFLARQKLLGCLHVISDPVKFLNSTFPV